MLQARAHAGAGAAVSQRAALQHRAARPKARRNAAFAASCGITTAHCLEAAIAAAVILEHHGWPPLVLSFESIDELDHVLFVYRHRGRWGSIGRSRDPGLHGRRAVFATPRALALSYVDAYVDFTGRVTGYTVADLRDIGNYDWRLAEGNVWKVERMLLNLPHRPPAHVQRAHQPAAETLSRVPRQVRAQADLLQAHGSMDGAAGGIQVLS